MDFGGLGDVESIIFQEGVTLAPMSCGAEAPMGAPLGATTVLPTAGLKDIEAGSLSGVVVPGGRVSSEMGGESGFEKLINTAHAEDMPVLAFGDGVSRTLVALGYDAPDDPPPGLLLHHGVRILESADEVRDAVKPFRTLAAAA